MICSNCNQKTEVEKSVILGGVILTGCPDCLRTLRQGHEGAAKYNRSWQQTEYRRDLLQPNQRDFVRGYGADTARGWGYSEDQIRKNS